MQPRGDIDAIAEQVEPVRRRDIRDRQQLARHRFRNARPRVSPIIVTEHRIAEEKRIWIERLHPSHRVGHRPRLLRRAQITGQHSIALNKPAVRIDPRNQLAHLRGRYDLASKRPVPRMVREQHGRHRPNLDAKALQREPRRAVPDMPPHDFGLNGQNCEFTHRPLE